MLVGLPGDTIAKCLDELIEHFDVHNKHQSEAVKSQKSISLVMLTNCSHDISEVLSSTEIKRPVFLFD